MTDLQRARAEFERFKAMNLNLTMQRGQPSDADFDLSNDLLQIVGPEDTLTPSGVEIRNYGGGVAGLPEARELFAQVLDVRPDEVIVGNNASLELQSHVLTWALLRGLKDSPEPWINSRPKMIVTVPGYDRHFTLLQTLGFDLATVAIGPEGPDMEAVARLAQDPAVKGILFVPTYSNPTGDTISRANAARLASLKAAAPDFTIFADDAYRVHHLTETPHTPVNFIKTCRDVGRPDRAYVFASTSKVTFGGAGLGYMASSKTNIDYISKLLGVQSIGPNKIEQYRHVKFLKQYPGGLSGLMREHAKIIAPKFEAVYEVLRHELDGTDLATWKKPDGGYFISLETTKPVAARVVTLSKEAGVSLTPAGATYPNGNDPTGSNIRLAPTRPPVEEVRQAMRVVAACIKLASAEYDQSRGENS